MSALARIIWALSINVRQKGQRRYISWSSSRTFGIIGEVVAHGAAEAVPARQGVPALHPAKDPGDARSSSMPAEAARRRGPGADLEPRDLLDRRGLLEVGQESGVS